MKNLTMIAFLALPPMCFDQTVRAAEDIRFYEGNNCTQDLLFTYDSSRDWEDNCKKGGRSSKCKGNNDEARSLLITNGSRRPLTITVYGSPNGSRKEGWTRIVAPRTTGRSICIGTFESSDIVNLVFGEVILDVHPRNGLDGKVSCISIR